MTWLCLFGDSDLRSAIPFNLSQEYPGKGKRELAFGVAQVASGKDMKSLKSCSLRAESWLYHFMSVWHWCSPLWNSVYCFVEWEWGFQFYSAIVHVKWGNGYKTLNTLSSTETKKVFSEFKLVLSLTLGLSNQPRLSQIDWDQWNFPLQLWLLLGPSWGSLSWQQLGGTVWTLIGVTRQPERCLVLLAPQPEWAAVWLMPAWPHWLHFRSPRRRFLLRTDATSLMGMSQNRGQWARLQVPRSLSTLQGKQS